MQARGAALEPTIDALELVDGALEPTRLTHDTGTQSETLDQLESATI
jgi:hypothetical protein